MKVLNKINGSRKRISVVMLFSLFICCFSCSKDDDTAPPVVQEEGGDVFKYEIVEIDYPGALPEQTEFMATMGSQSVTVIKTGEHTLQFNVPFDVPAGAAELTIAGLNNLTVKYNILEPVLNQSPEETMAGFMSMSQSYFSNIEQPGEQSLLAQSNFEQFQNYFDQNATDAEKEQIALFYQVNKQLIDDLILFDPSNAGRFTEDDILVITKFTTSVAFAVGGAFTVVYAADPYLKALGVAIEMIAISKAIDYHQELANRQIKVVLFNVDNIIGINDRDANNDVISLLNDVAVNIPFQITSRQLQQSDSDINNGSLASFFLSQSKYNNLINKTNEAIQFVNDYIPFISFSPFALASLNENPSTVEEDVTTEIMQDITFSVNHPNLQLTDASLSNTGELNLKVKIVGNPASTPVISTLNYTYNDEISSFTGSFPLEINSVPVLSVGDEYQGGVIVYFFQQGDMGFVEGEVHGIIAAQSDLGTFNWGCGGQSINDCVDIEGAASGLIGMGASNTQAIVNTISNNNAAKMCNDLVLNGYDDWFLPSRNELLKFQFALEELGISPNVNSVNYWSSTQYNSNNALSKSFYFSTGEGFTISPKSQVHSVRAVRYF